MKPSSFFSLVAAAGSVLAAPGHRAHDAHQMQRMHRRSGPLLHADMLALYAEPVPSTSTDEASAATSTAVAANGPYSGPHGGNPNVDTSSSSSSSDSSASATPIAAASRHSTPFQHAYKSAIPSWAIALAVVLSVISFAAISSFAFIKWKQSRQPKDNKLQNSVSNDKEDALSSYKAFWEAKRKSAGSFTSADANPAAVAVDAVADSLNKKQPQQTDLPRYTPSPVGTAH